MCSGLVSSFPLGVSFLLFCSQRSELYYSKWMKQNDVCTSTMLYPPKVKGHQHIVVYRDQSKL